MNIRVVLPLLLLAACGSGEERRPPLQGAAIGGPFSLIDGHGRRVTDRDFAGRYRIMYFGYTFCPDVCPTDMANISGGIRLLEREDPARARKIAVLFVTVDPERDTPKVVGQYAAAFGPFVTGLTGSPEVIKAVTKAFAVSASKEPSKTPGAYLVSHSRITYLMDPAGKPLALIPAENSPAAVVAELEKWVK